MSGHRQAAAALHGLADADRELILAALPRADQSALRLCLQEMTELGFESGIGSNLPQTVEPVSTDDSGRLSEAEATAMYVLLEHEPAVLIGQCLALGDWLWREDMLARFSPARREVILAAAARAPAPARARFLLAALEKRLAAVTPPPAPVRGGFFGSLLRTATLWTR